MKLSKFATLISAVMVLGMAVPSMAADHSSGIDSAVDGAMIVPRLGGVVAGTIVGTPVAIARETYKSYTAWTPNLADKMGAKDCGPACFAVSFVTLPAAIVWGTVTGTFYGTKNGVDKGFNTPFTKESFSFGKDVEE